MADSTPTSSERSASGNREHARARRTALRACLASFSERFAKLPPTARRVRVLVVVFFACVAVLGIRLLDLQVVRSDALSRAASGFRTRSYTLHAKRGDIVDAKGAVLATSVERYNIGVNQKVIGQYKRYDKNGKLTGTGAAAAAEELAPLLKMDRAELGGLLMGGPKKSSFVYVKKDVSPELWREINSLRIAGIEPEQYMKREYPNGSVGGNVLGYVGQTDKEPGSSYGHAGSEPAWESVLAGKNGKLTVEVAGGGAVLPNGRRTEVKATNGSTVKLTIDRDLQNQLMQAVDQSVAANNAEWGSAVVVEIGTGRILALVDSKSPNPADLGSTSSANWGSRAVQAPVEPGSTGKVVTFSAGIDQKAVTPTTTFTVPYSITMPNGETVHDNDPHGTETMTVAGILAKSYNTGLIQVGDKVQDQVRYRYMKGFGLGEKTGVELPAESRGALTPPNTWGPRGHYTTMFGQGWSTTTVQLGQMASIVGNKGMKAPLHIIDSVTSADGREKPTVTGKPKRVISEESAGEMLKMMQAVTDPNSTGWRAKVAGYNVAGKTGTAQVPDENGNLTKRVGTFVGVLPAEKPQIAVAVVVYNGSGAGYGGEVAAPVFSQVSTFAVRQLGIAPSTTPLYKYPWYKSEMSNRNG